MPTVWEIIYNGLGNARGNQANYASPPFVSETPLQPRPFGIGYYADKNDYFNKPVLAPQVVSPVPQVFKGSPGLNIPQFWIYGTPSG